MHSLRLRALAAALQEVLPSSLAERCRLLNVRGDCLILQVESPPWATRLRFYLPTVLEDLRRKRGWEHIHRADTRIRPPASNRIPPRSRGLALSPEARKAIHAAAISTSDPALGKALLGLLRHGDMDRSREPR
jgi:hypothetical protein